MIFVPALRRLRLRLPADAYLLDNYLLELFCSLSLLITYRFIYLFVYFARVYVKISISDTRQEKHISS